MADIELTTTATIGAGESITVTVFEDTNLDSTADNQASQIIDNGTNTYTLSGFSGGNNNDYWLGLNFSSPNDTTPSLDTATIEVPTGDTFSQTISVVIGDVETRFYYLRYNIFQNIGSREFYQFATTSFNEETSGVKDEESLVTNKITIEIVGIRDEYLRVFEGIRKFSQNLSTFPKIILGIGKPLNETVSVVDNGVNIVRKVLNQIGGGLVERGKGTKTVVLKLAERLGM